MTILTGLMWIVLIAWSASEMFGLHRDGWKGWRP